jgi:hypothetical protein
MKNQRMESWIGVVLEPFPGSWDHLAALQHNCGVKVGDLLEVVDEQGKPTSIKITKAISAGGNFTKDTAAYHLSHINDKVRKSCESNFLLVELASDSLFPLLAGQLIRLSKR